VFTRRGRGSATDDSASVRARAQTTRYEVEAGKGRATPKRADAERERRERARGPKEGRAGLKKDKQTRVAEAKRMRAAIDRGDERYMPNRDKGPVRRYLRDAVDARLTAAEFFMPVAIASLVLMVAGASGLGGSLSTMMILVVAFDSAIMTVGLRKAVATRFPDEPRRGAIAYAMMRALTWRSLRTPKPQVKRGEKP
jgi:Flp pilus assembly pilin Flp